MCAKGYTWGGDGWGGVTPIPSHSVQPSDLLSQHKIKVLHIIRKKEVTHRFSTYRKANYRGQYLHITRITYLNVALNGRFALASLVLIGRLICFIHVA